MKQLLSIFWLLICLNSCKPGSNKANEKANNQSLGLLFEKQDKLAGIPMASTPFGGDELPTSVDLSANMPPVGNQGSQQSCVAWSVAYALKSYQEKVESGQQLTFSPSFIYNQINNGQNGPTYVTDALNLLSQQGVCQYDQMPYNENDWTTKPNTDAKSNAAAFRIDFWRQVNVQDIKEVKAQLSAGYPIIIGAEISKEFITDGYALKQNFVWAKPGETAGGHAMLIVGYNDKNRTFKLMNSWGTDWGDKGFGYVDYDFFPKVVKYGFVAKDAFTNYADNKVIDNINNTTEATLPDEDDYSNQYAADTAYIESTDVQYNVTNSGDAANGLAMRIDGELTIPANCGRKFQVVVHVYNKATRQQVGSLIYPEYSDLNGYAASYTTEYKAPADGLNTTWYLYLPYAAINSPVGVKMELYAVPTLFIDGYGITHGNQIDFWLKK